MLSGMQSCYCSSKGANLTNYMDDAWRGCGQYVNAIGPLSFSWGCSYDNPPLPVTPVIQSAPVVPAQNRELVSDVCEYIRHPKPGSSTGSMLITTICFATHRILPTPISTLIAEFTASWVHKPRSEFTRISHYRTAIHHCLILGRYNRMEVIHRHVRMTPTSTEVVPFLGMSDAGLVLATVLQELISGYAY